MRLAADLQLFHTDHAWDQRIYFGLRLNFLWWMLDIKFARKSAVSGVKQKPRLDLGIGSRRFYVALHTRMRSEIIDRYNGRVVPYYAIAWKFWKWESRD